VPKKAVLIYLLLALLGAAIFVYFTFPRTKDEIPMSENQRPFPSSPGPNGVPTPAPGPTPAPAPSLPMPDTVPHPSTPKPLGGPNLKVMAWASGPEAKALAAELDTYAAATGTRPSLVIDGNAADYRRDLRQALSSDAPPDVCLVEARDFSGIDPKLDLAPLPPTPGVSPRSVAALTVDEKVRAVPDEFSVDVLFYNPRYFDEAGIGYPGVHWTWDIMEAITRALASLRLQNAAGAPVYPLELPADFDFWNILCMQAGHAALDLDTWHLADADSKDSEMRGLDLIHEFFHELTVTAPLGPDGATGTYFAQQRAALLIAPSELTATLPKFDYGMTFVPEDLTRASLARVNGWGVTERSAAPEAALALARFLGGQPVHAGWSGVTAPADPDSNAGVCYAALEQSLIPRLEPKTERLAEFLDQQIGQFARDPNDETSTANLYARIQSEYADDYAPSARDPARDSALHPKTDGPQVRGW
jgi:ABC-type glycerol-3-phosphate transport system substrate-binding protein